MNHFFSRNSTKTGKSMISKFSEIGWTPVGLVGLSSFAARPMEALNIELSTLPSDDQPLRAWSSLPGLRSLKVRNSVGATFRGGPIAFSSLNFDSFHRLSRRLSPTGGSSLQFT